MVPVNNSVAFLNSINIWDIAKIPALILLGMYVIFAIVVVRQVYLMTKTLEIGFELPIKIIGYLHLIFAVLLFVFAFGAL